MKLNLLIALAVLMIGVAACTTTASGNTVSDAGAMQVTNTHNGDAPAMEEGFSGKILAGTTTPYIEFNQADYDKAVADGKTIYIEFYANWCPSCTGNHPVIAKFWQQQNNEDVIAFRVNYKDSDTSKDEENMARQFGITSQHTRVIVKDGQVVYRKLGNFNAAEVSGKL